MWSLSMLKLDSRMKRPGMPIARRMRLVYVVGMLAFRDMRWIGRLEAMAVAFVFGPNLEYALALLPLCAMYQAILPQFSRSLFYAFIATAPVQWVLMVQLSKEGKEKHNEHESIANDTFIENARRTMGDPLLRVMFLFALWFVNPVRPSDKLRYHLLPISNLLFRLGLCVFAWNWIFTTWQHGQVEKYALSRFTVFASLACTAMSCVEVRR